MDRGAWQSTVPEITKCQTQLSDSHFTSCIYTHTAAWVWRVRHIGYNLQNECMCQGHYGEEISMSRISSVQFTHSVVSDSFRPRESQHARPPCSSQTQSLLKLMPIESVMSSSHLILCLPLLLLPPILPSIRVFSNEQTLCMR